MLEAIKDIVKNWFEKKEIDCFIGYTRKSSSIFSPICIYDASDIDKLDYGQGCYHNLMSYYDFSEKEKVGILLKGCDGRALVQLLSEGILNRDKIRVLGVVCQEDRNSTKKCKSCYSRFSPIFDKTISAPEAVALEEPLIKEEIKIIEGLTEQERATFFKKEFDKCIRCYACREICPLCYCEECITEKSDPQWVEASVKPSSNYYWNIIRAIHLAGRCIGCGECSRVCPGKIPLNLLHSKMASEVQKQSNYIAGVDIEKNYLDFEFKKDSNRH